MHSKSSVTLLLWLYHTDLVNEFYHLLKPLENFLSIRLCVCSSNNNNNAVSVLEQLSNITSIKFFSNIGADIYSFIDELSYIDTPYFIKLHSKKSEWGTHRHCKWRQILLDSLIGDIDTLYRNIKLLNKNIGYLSCKPFTYTNYESRSSKQITEILDIMGYNDNIPARHKLFTGGNMFAGNTQLFQQSLLPYQDKFKDLLKNEIGKVDEHYDGTYCHAFERIFGYISYLHGYRFSYSCPTLFKIITPTIHSKYLHFRLLYNNDIYCYDQANIFGNVITKNHNMLSIKWLHNNENTIQEYRKVANNTFINSKYID